MTKKKIRVGALIRVSDMRNKLVHQNIGTVLQLTDYKTSQKIKYERVESLSEVLWQDGTIGWILTNRLEVVDEEWRD